MSKRILVVEDQEDNPQIIRDMLAGTDYEITEAENGEGALEAISKQRPDLILMDIQLPRHFYKSPQTENLGKGWRHTFYAGTARPPAAQPILHRRSHIQG